MSGGSSSSSSASTNTTTNIDGRSVADAQGQSGYNTTNVRDNATNTQVSGNGNVVTDGGAFKTAVGAGVQGYEDLLTLTGGVFQAFNDIQKKNAETVDHITSTTTEAIQKARDAELKASDTNRYLVAAGIAVIGIVAVKVWAK